MNLKVAHYPKKAHGIYTSHKIQRAPSLIKKDLLKTLFKHLLK